MSENNVKSWRARSLRLAMAAAMLCASASPALASVGASRTFEISGIVPVVCNTSFQSAPVQNTDGSVQLGTIGEFCNDGQGYQVVANYTAGGDNPGSLIVDGRVIPLDGSGQVVIDTSSSAAIVQRSLAYQPGATRLTSLSLTIQSNT